MRLLIIEPTILKEESLTRLQDVGWGLCRVPRMEYLKVFRCEEALKFCVHSTKKKCQGLLEEGLKKKQKKVGNFP